MKRSGLAERAEQRRREKAARVSGPRKEALRYLRSLPTKTLLAVHRAAVQFHENNTTP